MDLTYQTSVFDVLDPNGDITVAPPFFAFFSTGVDDAAGLVTDWGGLTFTPGVGSAPNWAKVATIKFNVATTPTNALTFCTQFPVSGAHFGIGGGVGSVDEDDVDYRCLTIPTEEPLELICPPEVTICPDEAVPAAATRWRSFWPRVAASAVRAPIRRSGPLPTWATSRTTSRARKKSRVPTSSTTRATR